MAPDSDWQRGIRPVAALRAFGGDPRAPPAGPAASHAAGPIVLAVYRDDAEQVMSARLGLEEVVVWGLESFEADLETLLRVGVDDAAIARGRARLRALSLLR